MLRLDCHIKTLVPLLRLVSALLLAPILYSSGLTQEELKAIAPISEKQKAAEETADRILSRFYETLDFGTIYREMYVANPELRRIEVEIVTDHLMGGTNPHRKIAFSSREKAYIANSNFWWLVSALNCTNPKAHDSPEIAKVVTTLYKMSSRSRRKILRAEILEKRFTRMMNQLSTEVRNYVVRKNYKTTEYTEKVNTIPDTNKDEKDKLKEIFFAGRESDSDTEIYVVKRERYYYYLIEEKGSLKLLTFSSRIRF